MKVELFYNRLLVASLLIAIFVLSFTYILHYINLVDEVYYKTLISINLGLAAIAVTITSILLIERYFDQKNKAFTLILIILTLGSTIDSLALIAWKGLHADMLANVLLSVQYIIIDIIVLFLINSVSIIFSSDRKNTKRFTMIGIGICAMDAVCLIANLFTKNMWYIENEVMHHCDFFFLVYLFLGMLVIEYIVVCFTLIKNKIHSVVFSSMFAICVVVFVYADTEFNSSIIMLCIELPTLLILQYIYSKRDEELKTGKRELKLKRGSEMMSSITQNDVDRNIRTLESLDFMPEDVKEALEYFRIYMWDNFESFNNPSLIPLSKELENTKAFIYLEKLRFKDRLQIEYDIQDIDVLLPSLCIQILVENAIKHGLAKIEGGSVCISTCMEGENSVIIVSDNGVGFDQSEIRDTIERSHVGLGNIRQRLKAINGTLEIHSTVGIGTVAKIIIPPPLEVDKRFW